ncbi:MAG: putative motility protein [Methylobacterium sp.]|uniref:putative motility protein n=1 Tax=Methylobacterium sp. TaxID=409 RepID=UPI00258CF14D|nr:putative motility protein [Methylobacterium sp.]MBY0294500.1 putative motility protein [Methylobacterium sp.]
MSTIAAQSVQMLAASFSQQVGIAVARQQIDAGKAVAEMVAASASPPPPAGQGRLVDLKV